MSESGDVCHDTLDAHHLQDLGMLPLKTYPYLYVMKDGHRLVGL